MSYYEMTPPAPKLAMEYQGKQDNWLVFGGGGGDKLKPPYDDARFHDAIFITTPDGFNPAATGAKTSVGSPPSQGSPPTYKPITLQTGAPYEFTPPVSSPTNPVTPTPTPTPYQPPTSDLPVQPYQPPLRGAPVTPTSCGDVTKIPKPTGSVWNGATCSYGCPSGTRLWYDGGNPAGFCEPTNQGTSTKQNNPVGGGMNGNNNQGLVGTPPNTWIGGSGWIANTVKIIGGAISGNASFTDPMMNGGGSGSGGSGSGSSGSGKYVGVAVPPGAPEF